VDCSADVARQAQRGWGLSSEGSRKFATGYQPGSRFVEAGFGPHRLTSHMPAVACFA
jgi:hypothetical protein